MPGKNEIQIISIVNGILLLFIIVIILAKTNNLNSPDVFQDLLALILFPLHKYLKIGSPDKSMPLTNLLLLFTFALQIWNVYQHQLRPCWAQV